MAKKPKAQRSSRAKPARRRTDDVAIVVSRYNATITDRLLDGALSCYAQRFPSGRADVIDAPGAFELPVLAAAAARTGRYAGVLALGCVIRGETSHDRYIAHAVADGLTRIGLDTGIPAAFGVLTVDTNDQAHARAGGSKGNKGEESMSALLETIASLRAVAAGLPVKPRGSRPDKTREGA